MLEKSGRRMPVRLTLAPGKRGTLGLVREYGDRLVCVRYRYDKVAGRRYKTVELIVDEFKSMQGFVVLRLVLIFFIAFIAF